MDVVFFTQNPQKSQNLLDAKFASLRDSYNSADSACLKKASHRDSQNSAHSACLKKASHRDSQNSAYSACNNNITSP